MSDELFFIPLIVRALAEAHPEDALRRAFELIQRRGQEPRWARGYEQFLFFMQSAKRHAQDLGLGGLERSPVCQLLIQRDDAFVAVVPLVEGVGVQTVQGVTPGLHRIMLDTGQLLWDGRLGPEHLIWHQAFPERSLAMAADTGGARPQPTLTIPLLEGTVEVRVYAGLETGFIEVSVQRQEAGDP